MPLGSKVAVTAAVIGIGEVMSPPDITGRTCVVVPEEPVCTTVTVIIDGPKSERAVELVKVVPVVNSELLLLTFVVLVKSPVLAEEVNKDAEELENLDEDIVV